MFDLTCSICFRKHGDGDDRMSLMKQYQFLAFGSNKTSPKITKF